MFNLSEYITARDLVSSGITGAFSVFCWLIARLYESWISGRRIPYPISGEWYSLEYVPKATSSPEDCNTFTKVKVSRRLGGKWNVSVVSQLRASNAENEQTAWKFSGTMPHGDTLVGNWRSTVPNTKRYGSAVLKFVDNGRAIGYWIGPSRKDYPVYGYWIMSRYKEDVQRLGKAILEEGHFRWADAIGYVNTAHPYAP